MVCFSSHPVSAQVAGQVTDQAGAPIPSAMAELLGADSVFARGYANADGWFDLTPAPTATHVRVSRFGFETSTVPIGNLMAPLSIQLTAQPFELEGLDVAAGPAACPAHDDDLARQRLVGALAASDRTRGAEQWLAPILEMREGHGIGKADLEPRAFDHGQQGGQRLDSWYWMERRGAPLLFARRRNVNDLGGFGTAWHFFGFHGSASPWLGSAELISTAIVGAGSNEKEVLVCVTNAEGVSLQAAYALENELISSIRWRLKTPSPEETLGGQLDMFPSGGLLPRQSYVWWRDAVGRFEHELILFAPWFVGTESEVREAMRGYRRPERPSG